MCDALLPPYIKPLPDHLQQEDVEYLARKGALSVPEPRLRDELLRSYIEFVPGTLPEPDWHDVLAHVEQRHSTGPGVSLLLFQAIMFVGSAYVDMEHLERAGFKTRKSARQAFFQRARVSKISNQASPTRANNKNRFSTTLIARKTGYASFSHYC